MQAAWDPAAEAHIVTERNREKIDFSSLEGVLQDVEHVRGLCGYRPDTRRGYFYI